MPLSLLVAAWTNYMERIPADFCAERKPQAKIVTHCAVRRLSGGLRFYVRKIIFCAADITPFMLTFAVSRGRIWDSVLSVLRAAGIAPFFVVRRRRELPEMRSRPRLEISHRRISTAQKMAFLPRRKSSTSPPPPRRSQNLHRNHPPHRPPTLPKKRRGNKYDFPDRC